MKLIIVLVAILVALLSLSGVIGAGKRSMSKGTYDTIIKMIKGEFDVPVGQRTLEQRNAIVRFWRNQESYQLNEDGVLLCDGKLVITQSEIKNVIRTEFDQSKGKGPQYKKSQAQLISLWTNCTLKSFAALPTILKVRVRLSKCIKS